MGGFNEITTSTGKTYAIKANEKVTISNVNANKKVGANNKANPSILKAGETRVTYDGAQVYYSYNKPGAGDYLFNINKYADEYFVPIDQFENSKDKFYEYIEDAEKNGDKYFVNDQAFEKDLGKNPDEFVVNAQQDKILAGVVNTNNDDNKNCLSEQDLKDLVKNKERQAQFGIENIAVDGEKGVYNIKYKENGETKSLVFDFVLQGETQKVEDFEKISEKVHTYNYEKVEEYAKKVENYKAPNAKIGFNWFS